MSRIEDNDIERQERIKQEQKLQEKALDAKRQDASRQFSTVVSQMQQGRGQENKKDAEHSEQKQSASRSLMARQGIDGNRLTGQNLARNSALNDEGRRQAQAKDGEQAAKRGAIKQDQAPIGRTSGETRAVGGGAKQGQDSKSQSNEERRAKASSKEAAESTGAVFSAHATANAVDGVGGRTGALGPAQAALNAQDVIKQIVAQVRSGMDSKGFGLIQIDLRDDVLAGSRLTFLSSQSGIHLKVETGDQEVERLLSSGATAHELTTAMAAAQIKLAGLEVNGARVLG